MNAADSARRATGGTELSISSNSPTTRSVRPSAATSGGQTTCANRAAIRPTGAESRQPASASSGTSLPTIGIIRAGLAYYHPRVAHL